MQIAWRFGPHRMIVRTDHRAKGGLPGPCGARCVFTRVKKPVPNALPLILRQQNRFPEIEYLRNIHSLVTERILGVRLLPLQWRRRSRPDDCVSVPGDDKHRTRFAHKFGHISGFIFCTAVIQIGPAAKNPDPQIRQRRNGGPALLGIRQGTDVYRHETCAIQSARL